MQEPREQLAKIFGGRRWIVAFDVLAAATPLVSALAELGAERCLCVAASRGTGPLPDPELAPDPIVFETEATDLMGSIRVALELLANLPPSAVAQVDAFDPERRARVLGTIFDDGRPVAGRIKYGARPAEWQALEDKTRIDALWDAAGVGRAPSHVVKAERAALEAACAALDRGLGCVIAGDSREGFNGGASYLRWVRNADEVLRVSEFFEQHCSLARVMPFLEGIPCSIHGIVLERGTLVLRPCEMLVFRKSRSNELHYGRAATFWDPPARDREAMRELARRTGNHLKTTLGYRGAFTIDGVLSESGFLPTELNPRFGAALFLVAAKLDLPLLLLNAAVVEGDAAELDPEELEQRMLDVADRHRAGGGVAVTRKKQSETRKANLVFGDDDCRIALDGEQADATAVVGPSAMGGFVRVELEPGRTPIGPSAAARVARALACLDRLWDLEIGPLQPARDVRS